MLGNKKKKKNWEMKEWRAKLLQEYFFVLAAVTHRGHPFKNRRLKWKEGGKKYQRRSRQQHMQIPLEKSGKCRSFSADAVPDDKTVLSCPGTESV